MKIKNKLRYIFIFGIVLALLVSFSISVFAINYSYYYNIVNSGSGTRPVITIYLDKLNINKVTLHNSNDNLITNGVSFINIKFEQYVNTNNNNRYLYFYGNYYDSGDDEYYDYNFWHRASSVNDVSGEFDIYMNTDFCDITFILSSSNFSNDSISGFGNKLDLNSNSNYYRFHDGDILYLRNYYNGRYCLLTLYIHCVQSSQPLSKTYDVGSFYNNNTLYNQIIVDGVSEDNSSFSDITSITFKNSTENYQAVAYSNSSWTSGYNSNLGYFWNGTAPTVSSINSDLNSLITFSTSIIATDFDKSYNLEFQQNGNYYTSLRVVGTTINGNNFNSIQSINYNSDQVYVNNNFVSGYSNYLGYTFTPPDSTVLSNLNSDLGGLLVFYTVQVNPTPEEKFFHDIDVSTNGILTIVYAFANNLLSNIVLITMCVALPLVSFAVVQVIRIYKIKKGQ